MEVCELVQCEGRSSVGVRVALLYEEQVVVEYSEPVKKLLRSVVYLVMRCLPGMEHAGDFDGHSKLY